MPTSTPPQRTDCGFVSVTVNGAGAGVVGCTNPAQLTGLSVRPGRLADITFTRLPVFRPREGTATLDRHPQWGLARRPYGHLHGALPRPQPRHRVRLLWCHRRSAPGDHPYRRASRQHGALHVVDVRETAAGQQRCRRPGWNTDDSHLPHPGPQPCHVHRLRQASGQLKHRHLRRRIHTVTPARTPKLPAPFAS